MLNNPQNHCCATQESQLIDFDIIGTVPIKRLPSIARVAFVSANLPTQDLPRLHKNGQCSLHTAAPKARRVPTTYALSTDIKTTSMVEYVLYA